MAIEATAGAYFTARATGLTVTRFRIVEMNDGVTVVAGPITTGIDQTGTQRYAATVLAPAVPGEYEIQWDDGSGAWAAAEDVVVGIAAEDTSVTLAGLSWKFPGGTVVGAYPPTSLSVQSTASPIGNPTEVATVTAGGTVTFNDLRRGIEYQIGAQVSGQWRYVRFTA